jgi:hypothetical protein
LLPRKKIEKKKEEQQQKKRKEIDIYIRFNNRKQ